MKVTLIVSNSQRTPEQIQQDLHQELSHILNKDSGQSPIQIDLARYRRVRWFFFKAFMHVFFWDIFLNRPVLRYFRRPPLPRWQRIARDYRALAVEMGGVLIKLGQFLSIRVDILPPEVTGELAGLQDEIPAEPMEKVIEQLESDFGKPLEEVFDHFSLEPVGAASLAQAHTARLLNGQEVVVKVLRPGIGVLVETDLTAIALAIRWLKLYKRVSDRVDLDWLAEEFTVITRNELDFEAERGNVARFATDFADDPQVYVPEVYDDYSRARTLTMENVGYIKIGDLAAIEAAGISRAAVAQKFYKIYMEQIFVTNFVHVDPHPGNVFIRPLPHPDDPPGTDFLPGDIAPYQPDRPFQIVFVDFGMVATIPDRLQAALRDYAIGVGTRDAYKVVKSYQDAGVLLPNADVKRLEEATADMFGRLWGVRMGQVRDMAESEYRYFVQQYRDIVYEAPFQFPVDMLFVLRSIGILSGMATNLDPDFDPFSETIPFAERLAQEELQRNWRGWLQEGVDLGQMVLQLPGQANRILGAVERGDLTVQTSLAPNARRSAERLENAINRLTWFVMAAGMLIAGGNLYSSQVTTLGIVLMAGSAAVFLWGLFSQNG
jgi:predicted unusual protein kinase regulating ubiquinone biosynthesis (AarF/ABC1/UbiB family)